MSERKKKAYVEKKAKELAYSLLSFDIDIELHPMSFEEIKYFISRIIDDCQSRVSGELVEKWKKIINEEVGHHAFTFTTRQVEKMFIEARMEMK